MTSRLIEWTGERCVPWVPSPQLVYEHFHRYLWAASLVGDRRVLDLASGEGFGAAILARSASEVVGIDIDPRTIEHSRRNYDAANISFEVGDGHDLSAFDDGSFGAVVAFEMIEHVDEQARVLAQIARVLAPDGLLIISTPDRQAYAEENQQENPFHVRELTIGEFTALLRARFAHVATWGQRPVAGSALSALEPTPLGPTPGMSGSQPNSFFLRRTDTGWNVVDGLSPLYVIAVASNEPLPAISAHSSLADPGMESVRGAWETAEALRGELAMRDEQISELHSQLAVAHQRLQRVEMSVTWRLFQRARAVVFAVLGGERSAAAQALQRGLRSVGRLVFGAKGSPGSSG